MAGVNKEIWLAEIMEAFVPETSFVSQGTNMSMHVENDAINLADAGVAPEVLIDNNTYPIPHAVRTDTPIRLELSTYSTKSTRISNVEEMEITYDKLKSVLGQHKNSLRVKLAEKAAHAWAPMEEGAYTPVIASSGAAEHGFKKVTLDDILTLESKFDALDIPEGNRILVLHPTHLTHLKSEDKTLFKSYVERKPGFGLFGFQVYKFTRMPKYHKSTGKKVAFGATATANDAIASIAFVGSEVMYAQGVFDFFARLRDPDYQGDIINFQMRALALPIRNKGIAALYSAGA